MAVALDATGGGGTGGGTSVTSISWSHIVGAGSDRLLVVTVGRTKTTDTDTVTYSGTALTRVAQFQTSTGSNDVQLELWVLLNPPTGTANVVVTPQNANTLAGGSQSFTGVDQTTPNGVAVSATGTGTTASATASSATGNMVIGAIAAVVGSAPTASGTGQTRDFAQSWGSSLTRYAAGSHQAGAASVTESWTIASALYLTAALPLYAVGAAPTPRFTRPNVTSSRAVMRAAVI